MMAQTLSLRIRHQWDAAYDGKVHNVFQVACEFQMNAITVSCAAHRFALLPNESES
jgi:hypothetical protein